MKIEFWIDEVSEIIDTVELLETEDPTEEEIEAAFAEWNHNNARCNWRKLS